MLGCCELGNSTISLALPRTLAAALCRDAAPSTVGTGPTAANGEDPADPDRSWLTGFGWVFLPEEAKLGYTSLWKWCLLSQAFPFLLVPLLVLKMKAFRAESRCLSLFRREKEKKTHK